MQGIIQTNENARITALESNKVDTSIEGATTLFNQLQEASSVTNLDIIPVTINDVAKKTKVSSLINLMYPIGSIYMSVAPTSPTLLFGGTWEAFGTGKTLVGVDANDTDFDTVEETGGAKTINLAHSHTVNSHSHTMSHTHTLTTEFSSTYKVGNGLYYVEGGSIVNSRTTGGSSAGNTGNSSPGTNSQLSSTQSILQPYITVYMWKRIA